MEFQRALIFFIIIRGAFKLILKQIVIIVFSNFSLILYLYVLLLLLFEHSVY